MTVSPCVGLCRLDERSGLCAGCARTGAEIAVWGRAPAQARERIWAELPARRRALGLALHRPNWDVSRLRAFILDTLRPGGAWTAGVPGALAEFSVGEHEPCEIEVEADVIRAASPRGAICFRLGEHVRALSFAEGPDAIIVLAVHAGAAPAAQAGLARLGPDMDAVRKADAADILYDFGLGRSASFGLRTARADLLALLDGALGLRWQKFLPRIGAVAQRASPARVVRSPIGRIEVFAPIAPPGGVSPDGPHTHFLPDILAQQKDSPSGIAMPDGFIACATYYPPRPGVAAAS